MQDPMQKRDDLENTLLPVLPEFLKKQRWFGGKSRTIVSTQIADIVPIAGDKKWAAFLVIARVVYADGVAESYALPLESMDRERFTRLQAAHPAIPVLWRPGEVQSGIAACCDALWDAEFSLFLLKTLPRRARFGGREGEIEAIPSIAFERLTGPIAGAATLDPSLINREQSNTSIVFGGRLIMKVFRRLEEDVNPEVELGTFLSEHCAFTHVPTLAGQIVYRKSGGRPISAALVQAFVPNEGDGWRYTLSALRQFFNHVADSTQQAPPIAPAALLTLARHQLSGATEGPIGSYLNSARLLGQRTAELHIALASDSHDPSFAPERFSLPCQRALHQAMVAQTDRAFCLLRRRHGDLQPSSRELANSVERLETKVRERFNRLLSRELEAWRTRIHGDYHLGQILRACEDFVIVDFEGEPSRPISERRSKLSPLKDVAGMLRSFHYAAEAALLAHAADGPNPSRPEAPLKGWAHYWRVTVSAAFLGRYLTLAERASLLPSSPADLEILLETHQLEKAVYELEYELDNRPDWVRIPLEGIRQIMDEDG